MTEDFNPFTNADETARRHANANEAVLATVENISDDETMAAVSDVDKDSKYACRVPANLTVQEGDSVIVDTAAGGRPFVTSIVSRTAETFSGLDVSDSGSTVVDDVSEINARDRLTVTKNGNVAVIDAADQGVDVADDGSTVVNDASEINARNNLSVTDNSGTAVIDAITSAGGGGDSGVLGDSTFKSTIIPEDTDGTETDLSHYDSPVAVHGNYVYWSPDEEFDYENDNTPADWLLVADISDPTNPTQVEAYELYGVCGGIHATDANLYTYDNLGNLFVFDNSDPTSLTRTARIRGANDHANITVDSSENWAYVNGNLGLEIIDLVNESVETYAERNTNDHDDGILFHEDRIYTGINDNGAGVVNVIDVSTRDDPVPLGVTTASKDLLVNMDNTSAYDGTHLYATGYWDSNSRNAKTELGVYISEIDLPSVGEIGGVSDNWAHILMSSGGGRIYQPNNSYPFSTTQGYRGEYVQDIYEFVYDDGNDRLFARSLTSDSIIEYSSTVNNSHQLPVNQIESPIASTPEAITYDPANDNVIVGWRNDDVTALDPANLSTIVWQVTASGTPQSVHTSSTGDIYVGCGNGDIIHYDGSGTQKNSASMANGISSVAVASDGAVFVTDEDTLEKYNSSLSSQWSDVTFMSFPTLLAPLANGNIIVSGSYGIQKFLSDGTSDWFRDTEQPVYCHGVSPEGKAYCTYRSTDSNEMKVLDTSDGSLIYSHVGYVRDSGRASRGLIAPDSGRYPAQF